MSSKIDIWTDPPIPVSLTDDTVREIKALREAGETVPAIIKRTSFSKASISSSAKRHRQGIN